jgi:hypothetical protein
MLKMKWLYGSRAGRSMKSGFITMASKGTHAADMIICTSMIASLFAFWFDCWVGDRRRMRNFGPHLRYITPLTLCHIIDAYLRWDGSTDECMCMIV